MPDLHMSMWRVPCRAFCANLALSDVHKWVPSPDQIFQFWQQLFDHPASLRFCHARFS